MAASRRCAVCQHWRRLEAADGGPARRRGICAKGIGPRWSFGHVTDEAAGAQCQHYRQEVAA